MHLLVLYLFSSSLTLQVLDHDPIVAPGFGTAKDVARLADQLGIPVQAVDDIMKARGDRGGGRSSTRGIKTDPNEGDQADTNTSSAWADFLGEEGVEQASTAADSKKSGGKRTYKIPSLATPSKSKKTKLAAGTLIQAGTLDSSIVGRTKSKLLEVYDCAIPSLIMPQTKIAAVFTGCNSVHSIALAQNGTIYGWGRNESHQLGSNLPSNVALPTVLDVPGSAAGASSAMLQHAATGKGHSIFLMQDGSVYALGANKAGQCGTKTSGEPVPRPRKCLVVDENNSPIEVVARMVACGEDFSVLLDSEGFVYSTGSSEFGQLGNGETGEYFVQANKLAFANCNVFTRRTDHWYYQPSVTSSSSQPNLELELLPDAGSIRIQAISCGKHHTIALEAESSNKEKPRLFSWVSLVVRCSDALNTVGVVEAHMNDRFCHCTRDVATMDALDMVGKWTSIIRDRCSCCRLPAIHPMPRLLLVLHATWSKQRTGTFTTMVSIAQSERLP